jgi:hypothetical protein
MPRRHRVEQLLRDERGDEAADPHRQARDGVGHLVVTGAAGAGRRRVAALPQDLGGHRTDEGRDGQDGQIGSAHKAIASDAVSA